MSSLITNVFEEGSTNFAFASCTDIGDLRGYTCGYVGFTTGTNDAETVIKAYSKKQPNNAFKPYLSKLAKISALPFCDRKGRGNTKGLEGFSKAWKTEACRKGEEFPKVQKDWAYKNYMIPSARYAAAYGVNSALGRAIFYDTIIQHGYQYVEQDINIVRVLTLTGGRKKNESEQSFLTRFLTIRRELQCCYPDDVWPDSATRSEDLQGLVNKFSTNKDLEKPVRLTNFGVTVKGTEQDSIDTRRCKKTK
ncbi:lysozyme-like domain-containing protein [Phycomyces nitens]|nr:lysozyme-like domain-containing protein [Phycomyces nitens]